MVLTTRTGLAFLFAIVGGAVHGCRSWPQSIASIEEEMEIQQQAQQAYVDRDLQRAKLLAERLVHAAWSRPFSWNTGNTWHHGYRIMGLVAFDEGRLDEAKSHLISSGHLPKESGGQKGSPQLNTFGPGMLLAKKLLEQGEREVVLKYFEACRAFWDTAALDRWEDQVRKGEIPNFKPNLR